VSNTQQNRYVLVTRKTRLQELVERFNTWPQARFYLEHNHVDAEDYLREHDLYTRRILEAESFLQNRGLFQRLERGFLPNYTFGANDIVVVIGQDGLVANTLKYLSGQPVIGINPDPDRWDGKLLSFEVGDLGSVLSLTEKKRANLQSITFAEAKTNDGQSMLAVNDLFLGPKTHASARYSLSWQGKTEIQSSSGIIISTGFGSTGWFQSILAGALGVTGGESHSLQRGFGWDEKRLQFSVREPFPSRVTGTKLVFGEVTEEKTMQLESLMPENGVIFSDGIENDFLPFNSGSVVSIGVAETSGVLVVT
jgi:NAD kinase